MPLKSPKSAPSNREVAYHPELARWERPLFSTPKKSAAAHTYHLREHLDPVSENDREPEHESEVDERGRPVAVITISGTFSDVEARRIVTLMGFAPLLWRWLRYAAPKIKDDPEGVMEFAEIERILWEAAERKPFDFEMPTGDEDLLRRRMNMRANARPTRSKAGAA